MIRFVYVPNNSKSKRKGLAEKRLKQRLERKGWNVYRGGILNIIRKDEIYPNVRRKYEQLAKMPHFEYLQYLCEVHHGMPDFLCERRGHYFFVECKLGHEQLSNRQKKCIEKLSKLGFDTEVHKLVDPCTKLREAKVDIWSNEKFVEEKQLRIKLRY